MKPENKGRRGATNAAAEREVRLRLELFYEFKLFERKKPILIYNKFETIKQKKQTNKIH